MQHFTNEFFVRIKVPQFIDRFVEVEGRENSFILIEEVIAANIRHFAPETEPESVFYFRITRGAYIALREDGANDLLQMMELNLKQHRFGDVVRLEVSQTMPQEMVDYLVRSLEIGEREVYRIDGPMNITDAFTIAAINRPDLKDKPLSVTCTGSVSKRRIDIRHHTSR